MSDSPIPDPLTTLLSNLNLSAKVFGTPSMCDQWRLDTGAVAPSQFHMVARGTCYLHMHHFSEPLHLRAGDLIAVFHGDWHVLSSSPILIEESDQANIGEGKGPFTSIICGQINFSDRSKRVLADLLPPVIVIHSNDAGDRLANLMKMLAEEGFNPQYGSGVMLDKLADALLIMVLRHYLEQSNEKKGLLAAMTDEKLKKIISAVHQSPGDAWTVERMAEISGMSRSSLIERFSRIVGMTPVNYVTEFRMLEAERRLQETKQSVSKIAADLGYATETAFRKAYRRTMGCTASETRKKSN